MRYVKSTLLCSTLTPGCDDSHKAACERHLFYCMQAVFFKESFLSQVHDD